MKKKILLGVILIIVGGGISEAIDIWTGVKLALHTLPTWARMTHFLATMGFGALCAAIGFWVRED